MNLYLWGNPNMNYNRRRLLVVVNMKQRGRCPQNGNAEDGHERITRPLTLHAQTVRMLHFIGNRIPADGAGKPWVPSLLQGPNRILICSPDQQLYFLVALNLCIEKHSRI